MEEFWQIFNFDITRGDISVYKSNGATRISVPAEHYTGSASVGSVAHSYRGVREIFAISKNFVRKLKNAS